MSTLSEKINAIASQADLTQIKGEDNVYSQLPEGYYLCEATDWELREVGTNKEPMYMIKMKIVDDGITIDESTSNTIALKNTKNKTLNLLYMITTTANFERFVNDMLKFEQDEGVPLLEKEYFNYDETINDALDLTKGKRLWVQVYSYLSKNDNTTKYGNRPISFARAEKLGIEMPF